MDRNTTIGYVLLFGIFIAFYFINKQNVEDIDAQKLQKDSTEQAAATSESKSIENNAIASAQREEVAIQAADSALQATHTQFSQISEELYILENDKIELTLSNVGGVIKKVRLKEFSRYDSSDLILFSGQDKEMFYRFNLGSGTLDTRLLKFTADSFSNGEGKGYVFTAPFPEGGSLIQEYNLTKDGYLVGYKVKLKEAASNFRPRDKFFELNWNTKLQNQEKTLAAERENSTVYYKYKNETDVEYITETKEEKEVLQANVHWISFKQKFFNTTLISEEGFEEEGAIVETQDAADDSYVKKISSSVTLSYDGNPDAVYAMKWYFGPNHYQTLKKMDVGLEKIIPLGWGIFGWVNKFAVIPIFNFLNRYFVSYGLIILLLTIAIKVVLFPLMYKSYLSMAKMKVLKPELDEIKANAGNDMQKMQQEQMKLYKKAGVSPFGGCLPLLVQMPILYAMFRFFPASIELRQEPLWWTDDLSTYDSIFNLGFSIPFYGDHVSLFTLLMTLSTFLYTAMNNQMTGASGQMKIISYLMPVMFLGFFNNYPAALSYYYFLANMITFTQNWVIRKFFVDEAKIHLQIQENKKRPVTLKKSAMQKKLEEMAKKRGIDPYTGKKKK